MELGSTIRREDNTKVSISTITRTHERYYVLTCPDGNQIGADSKTRLERYARSNNWQIQHKDDRPKEMRIEHSL